MSATFLRDLSALFAIAASLIASYVALMVRPIMQRLNALERTVEKNQDLLSNHDRFRARVEVLLSQNVQDHLDIKERLKEILRKLDRDEEED